MRASGAVARATPAAGVPAVAALAAVRAALRAPRRLRRDGAASGDAPVVVVVTDAAVDGGGGGVGVDAGAPGDDGEEAPGGGGTTGRATTSVAATGGELGASVAEGDVRSASSPVFTASRWRSSLRQAASDESAAGRGDEWRTAGTDPLNSGSPATKGVTASSAPDVVEVEVVRFGGPSRSSLRGACAPPFGDGPSSPGRSSLESERRSPDSNGVRPRSSSIWSPRATLWSVGIPSTQIRAGRGRRLDSTPPPWLSLDPRVPSP